MQTLRLIGNTFYLLFWKFLLPKMIVVEISHLTRNKQTWRCFSIDTRLSYNWRYSQQLVLVDMITGLQIHCFILIKVWYIICCNEFLSLHCLMLCAIFAIVLFLLIYTSLKNLHSILTLISPDFPNPCYQLAIFPISDCCKLLLTPNECEHYNFCDSENTLTLSSAHTSFVYDKNA